MAPDLRSKLLPLLCGSLLFAPLCAQEAVKDVLSLRDGRKLRGVEITAATSTSVQYKHRNTTAEVAASLVAEIEWDHPPDEMAQARGAQKSGDATMASNYFLTAAGKTTRAPLKSECEFLAAQALQMGSVKDKAASADAARKLEEWVNANADGFRLPDALLALGRAQVAAEQYPEAEASFKKLADETLSRSWSPIWSARAKIGQAQAQVARRDFANARSTYRSTLSALQSLSEQERKSDEVVGIQAEAMVGTGDSLVREGKFDDALSYFRDEIGRTAESDAIRAAAKAGEGEAIFLKAQASGAPTADLRRAQIAFAEANLLDTVGGDTTAKALYYTAMVLLALGPDRDGSAVRQRANEYLQAVIDDHAGSRWAALAASEIKK